MVNVKASSSAESEQWFRVRVDLSRFFRDERARALVLAPRGRRVRWLHRRLRALFALPPRLALLARGHLLPRAEPLALLEQDDTVQVVPRKHKGNYLATDVDLQLSEQAEPSDAATSSPSESANNVSQTLDVIDGEDVDEEHVLQHEPPALLESKRRALLALERLCAKPELANSEETPPPSDETALPSDDTAPAVERARRRRVRRRRRPAPTAEAAHTARIAHTAHTADTAHSAVTARTAHTAHTAHTAYTAHTAPAPSESALEVLRNGSVVARAPRLVRPLPAPPPAPLPAESCAEVAREALSAELIA